MAATTLERMHTSMLVVITVASLIAAAGAWAAASAEHPEASNAPAGSEDHIAALDRQTEALAAQTAALRAETRSKIVEQRATAWRSLFRYVEIYAAMFEGSKHEPGPNGWSVMDLRRVLSTRAQTLPALDLTPEDRYRLRELPTILEDMHAAGDFYQDARHPRDARLRRAKNARKRAEEWLASSGRSLSAEFSSAFELDLPASPASSR